MCNPRRVEITATRELAEAWSHEVTRRVEVSGHVVGEARLRQGVSSTLGAPVLGALEAFLASGEAGWQAAGGGYRFDVPGGYAVYHPQQRELEIVATQEDEVHAAGEAQEQLKGELRALLTAKGEATGYDDNWGGQGEEWAKEKAQAAAERGLEEDKQRRLAAERKRAEEEAADGVAARAQAEANRDLERRARERQASLSEEAAERLEAVGARARQAFHRLLARAYRDAILDYARRHGGQVTRCTEGEDVLEVELEVER
jgi:hypothetical protein